MVRTAPEPERPAPHRPSTDAGARSSRNTAWVIVWVELGLVPAPVRNRGDWRHRAGEPHRDERGSLPRRRVEVRTGRPEGQEKLRVSLTVARRGAGDKDRRIILRFCVSPVALIGSAGHVGAITLERNELIPDGHGGVTARGTGRRETVDGIGLVFRAVGYRGMPIPGVPFDDHAGHIANVEGRVTTANAVV
jgi:hypothetical protein